MLLQEINPNLTKSEGQEIYELFSTGSSIPLRVCIAKLSKLAMKPNINDPELR